ncbi:MAG: hypothetical protein IKU65_00180 [Oscillospiraceae bacterium]|nr:hypothetical protein [Oscillospiraceae bacterium]
MKGKTPKLGFVAMALPGYFLGDEMCKSKRLEGIEMLKKAGYDVVAAPAVFSPEEAFEAGKMLEKENVDCLVVFLTTFVADYFVTELTKACTKPTFIWAHDREVTCISMVCTPLITASLKTLGRDCCVVSGEIDDSYCLEQLFHYSRAAMLKNCLYGARFGYSGHKPEIMYSMAANEYLLDRKLGVTIVNMPIEDFYAEAEKQNEDEIRDRWEKFHPCVGCADVRDEDGLLSIRYYMAARAQVEQKKLQGYSLNCFPNLKAKICLGISMLNDECIGAGCEGDLHATILMTMVGWLTGQPAFNGDFLQLDRERNAIMFSHCGAGATKLAGCPKNISLKRSIETNDGLSVFYETEMPGTVTLVNLMNGSDELRLSVMRGESVKDNSGYEGNPLALRFDGDVRTMPDVLAQAGTGHHWIGLVGDWVEELRLFARMTGLKYTFVSPKKD